MSGNYYPYTPYQPPAPGTQYYQTAPAPAGGYPQLYPATVGAESYSGSAAAAHVQAYHQAWYTYAYQQHAAHQQLHQQQHQQVRPIPTVSTPPAPPVQQQTPAAPSPAPATSTPFAASTTNTSATAQPARTPGQSSFSAYTPSYPRTDTSSHTFSNTFSSNISSSTREAPRASRKSQLKGLFAKELPKLMYGFGDDKQVANDSVSVMEEILIEYIVDMCQYALQHTASKKSASGTGAASRLQIEDLRRALGRDPKKRARMEELLFMQEDIKRARKQFEDGDGVEGGALNGI